MTIEFGDEWDEDEARRAKVIRRARTEGVEAAYEAALAICRDTKAPQQAKSNASRTLLQIGGLFEKQDDSPTKQLHEMSAAELAAAVEGVRRRLTVAEDGSNGDSKAPGVFG